jgi:hypothetical protein
VCHRWPVPGRQGLFRPSPRASVSFATPAPSSYPLVGNSDHPDSLEPHVPCMPCENQTSDFGGHSAARAEHAPLEAEGRARAGRPRAGGAGEGDDDRAHADALSWAIIGTAITPRAEPVGASSTPASACQSFDRFSMVVVGVRAPGGGPGGPDPIKTQQTTTTTAAVFPTGHPSFMHYTHDLPDGRPRMRRLHRHHRHPALRPARS